MASIFKSFGFNITVQSQILLTTPNNTVSLIILCQAANKSTTNQSITVVRHDALSNIDVVLAPSVVVPSKSSVNLLTGKLVIMPGDTLFATSSVDGAIDLTISSVEMTQSG